MPGINLEERFGERGGDFGAQFLDINIFAESDLNRIHAANAARRIDHAAHFLQAAQRHEHEIRVMAAHLAFVNIDNRKVVAADLRWLAGRGERDLDIVAGDCHEPAHAVVIDQLLADDDADVLFFFGIKNGDIVACTNGSLGGAAEVPGSLFAVNAGFARGEGIHRTGVALDLALLLGLFGTNLSIRFCREAQKRR